MSLKKSYGQHFLHDANIITKIVGAVHVESNELLIEVGPGSGALTKQLCTLPLQKGSKEGVESGSGLVLIEADRDLLPSLHVTFPSARIIHADAAQVDYDAITCGCSWVFVSNLPYNAGNAILENVLTSKNPPRQLVIMVQKEVGERMTAMPGDMSVLSVATQLYCTVERLFIVKPGAFTPPPKVDSMVLRLTVNRDLPPIYGGIEGGGESEGVSDHERVIHLAKLGFTHRRKQLRQTLAHAKVADLADIDRALEEIGHKNTVRPQELSTDNWRKMYTLLGDEHVSDR